MNESYPAIATIVPRARNSVAGYAERSGGFSSEQLDGIRLAVSEAVTNAVVHAYRQRDGLVHVNAGVVPGELWIRIADDGCGFETPAERPGLGWGLAVIADAADEFAIAERAEGGTEVRMRFKVGEPGSSGDQSLGSISAVIAPASSRLSATA